MPEHRNLRVAGQGRLRGTLYATSLFLDDRQYRLIRSDTGRDYLIPGDSVRAREDGAYEVMLPPEELEGYAVERRLEPEAMYPRERQAGLPFEPGRAAPPVHEERVIPLAAEQLHVGKRAVETSRLRIHKRVKEEEAVVDEPVVKDHFEIKRVFVNRPVSGPVQTRVDGDTLIIPLLEETLVTEKRLVLREELHVTRKREATREPKKVKLRKEYVDVERVQRTGS